ncbi:MAG: transglutaminase family protein [Candidatus Neptunochlamydia sp.]|nr:transglutaminase family protein [Candidatus Neptunochlamydia sp.]
MKALLFFLLPTLFLTAELSDARLTTLYRSLNPESISELFAFYHLYPNTKEGLQALSDAWELIHKHRTEKELLKGNLILPGMEIDSIISLVNKQPFETDVALSEQQLEIIEMISDHLSNRKLKGHFVWKKEELFTLPPEEIDLSHALLLYQFEDDPLKVRQYEATLDLIALQILAHLPVGATDLEKIDAISHFIFYEKRFRFPPHSIWVKDIDTYTFLPSVLDSHLGVCLGVSILYLSIAERLDLPLEIITPPGHIYIRYRQGEETLNIETTARGIHIRDRMYLGINTRKLQERNKKEVIGLAFINQASVAWQKDEYQTTVELYEKALPFLPNDPLLKMFLGYNYLFVGKEKEGRKLLNQIKDHPFDFAVARDVTPEDYLTGKVSAEGIKTIFLHVDETRASILEKQQKLQKVLKKFPDFRDGILQLAITYLQLGQREEAFRNLNRYHALDPHSPVVEYYLSIVALNRFRYSQAWQHLEAAEVLTKKRNHSPQCLKELRHTLRRLYPDPQDTL